MQLQRPRKTITTTAASNNGFFYYLMPHLYKIQNQLNIMWILTMIVLLWLHGISLHVVIEGQKGLVTRFLWSFVIMVGPLVYFIPNKTWRKTCAALLYFEFATCIMSCSASLAWYRNPKNLRPLPDYGHDTFPEWKTVGVPFLGIDIEAAIVPDLIMTVLTVSTGIFAMLHSARWKIVQRFFLIYGSLCMMRSVTVISTSLPDSAAKCRMLTETGNLPNGAHGWEAITVVAVLVRSVKLLIPTDGQITCGDMVFSGHSMLMVLCAMTWHTYYKWVSSINYVKVVVWILTFFGLLSIVMVRMHYTLDVLLAFYMAITIWGTYHRLANDVQIGHRFYSVWIIDEFVIYPAVEWFEKEIS